MRPSELFLGSGLEQLGTPHLNSSMHSAQQGPTLVRYRLSWWEQLGQWWAIVLQFETTLVDAVFFQLEATFIIIFSHELGVVLRLMAVWCPMRLMVAWATQLDAALRLGYELPMLIRLYELPMLIIAVAQRLRIGFQLHRPRERE